MDIGQFVQQYFISPMWERTGYNIVNTAAYAAIAIICLYAIYRLFEKSKFQIGKCFWAGALSWVVFGSSMRVIVDSVDSGKMAQMAGQGGIVGQIYGAVLQSHIFDYGPLTVSPGIYLLVAGLFFAFTFAEWKLKKEYLACMAGGILAFLNLLILLPMLSHFAYALLAVAIAAVAAFLAIKVVKLEGWKLVLPVFAQALDGAATWIAIDIFGPSQGVGYFEQHVLSGAIGQASPLGFGLFFLLKVVFAVVAVKLIAGEKDERLKGMVLLVIMIVGLAPGIRDILRMAAGT